MTDDQWGIILIIKLRERKWILFGQEELEGEIQWCLSAASATARSRNDNSKENLLIHNGNTGRELVSNCLVIRDFTGRFQRHVGEFCPSLF